MTQTPPQSNRPLLRIGSIAFLVGLVIVIVSTALHPSREDPANHRLVFAEYASDNSWIAVHIGQFKFSKEGTISVRIERKRNNEDAKDVIVIGIKDTGSGIHAEIMPKLFSKFASKSFSGTGLGLYISKSIVEACEILGVDLI